MESGLEEKLPIDMVQGPPEPEDCVLKYLYDRAQREFRGVIPIRQVAIIKEENGKTKRITREGFSVRMCTAPDRNGDKYGADITLVRNSKSIEDHRTQYDLKIPKKLVTGMIVRNVRIELVIPHVPSIVLNYESDTDFTKFFYCAEERLRSLQLNVNSSQASIDSLIWTESGFQNLWHILWKLDENSKD